MLFFFVFTLQTDEILFLKIYPNKKSLEISIFAKFNLARNLEHMFHYKG